MVFTLWLVGPRLFFEEKTHHISAARLPGFMLLDAAAAFPQPSGVAGPKASPASPTSWIGRC